MKSPALPSVQNIVKGTHRDIGRVLTLIEQGDPRAGKLLSSIERKGRKQALRIGITGPMGCGKSTLISAMTSHFRKSGLKTAILAVDPTSPISGGAFLGDRVRMRDFCNDRGVFIRSLASRGQGGGTAPRLDGMVRLLESAGFNLILIETVGTGQTEVAIRKLTDIVVVVTMPGLGDGIQAMKGGLFEIADILLVNKSDLPGAARQMAIFKEAFQTSGRKQKPLLMKTNSLHGDGVPALCKEIIGRAEKQ